jgi:hypothetical protein
MKKWRCELLHTLVMLKLNDVELRNSHHTYNEIKVFRDMGMMRIFVIFCNQSIGDDGDNDARCIV